MRWIAFIILACLLIVLQTTVAPFIAVHSIRPDLMVLAAVYYALMARRRDALLACWCLGFAVDLNGLPLSAHSTVGVSALAYGLAGLLVVRLRELTFPEHVLTYVVIVTAWTFWTDLASGLHLMWRLEQPERFANFAVRAGYAALYSAVLAPYAHWLLRRLRNVLGLGAVRTVRVRG
jgi:rod shape-determining protein MreD